MQHLGSQPRARSLALALAVGLSAALAVGSGAVHSQVPPPSAVPTAPAAQPPQALPVAVELQRFSDGFASVAAAVLPSVVSLRVEVESNDSDTQGLPRGFPFPFPFGGNGGNGGRPEVHRGTGSGVIVRSDGVIVTNNHVVNDARRIMVHLRDGRVLPGRVLGTDPATDLAVVKIDATNLTAARWADSDGARVGEWVLAIGAPFGLEATVTHGVLSATGRAGLGQNAIEDYLQTDASINPGNSGGALVNLRGEVLGINSMILGRGTGIGFAVPSRIARMAAQQIAETGTVSRGWVGVGLQDLSPDLAAAMNVPAGSGAVVSQVTAGSPGQRAGVRVGDVVTTVDGRRIASSHEAVREVTSHAPGQRIALAILRGTAPITVNVEAGRRPGENPQPERVRAMDRDTAPSDPLSLGVELIPLPPDRARMLGASRAVMVTQLEQGGAAERAGLRRGDVILRADGREVGSSGDLLAATQDGRAALLVRRRDGQLFVPLNLR